MFFGAVRAWVVCTGAGTRVVTGACGCWRGAAVVGRGDGRVVVTFGDDFGVGLRVVGAGAAARGVVALAVVDGDWARRVAPEVVRGVVRGGVGRVVREGGGGARVAAGDGEGAGRLEVGAEAFGFWVV